MNHSNSQPREFNSNLDKRRTPASERPATSAFGLRLSGFFRPSAFRFRISAPLLACWVVAGCTVMTAWASAAAPVKIVFDTDVGNDVDDVQAARAKEALVQLASQPPCK